MGLPDDLIGFRSTSRLFTQSDDPLYHTMAPSSVEGFCPPLPGIPERILLGHRYFRFRLLFFWGGLMNSWLRDFSVASLTVEKRDPKPFLEPPLPHLLFQPA